MLIILFGIKRIVHKEFVLEVQTVNSIHYCDVLWRLRENVPRLRHITLSAKDLAVASRQLTVSHFLFIREFFTKSNMTVVTQPPYFSVSLFEDKTERPPF
jgi:hypothetical protein